MDNVLQPGIKVLLVSPHYGWCVVFALMVVVMVMVVVVGGGYAVGSGVLAQANTESQRVMPNGGTRRWTFVGGRGKP